MPRLARLNWLFLQPNEPIAFRFVLPQLDRGPVWPAFQERSGMAYRLVFLNVFALTASTFAANAQSAPCTGFPSGAAELVCTCSGAERGSVWGSGPYTSDSNICVAALHAGVIGPSGGQVRAVARPGQQNYAGTIANGVQTSNWGSYGSSFAIEPVRSAVEACQRFPVGTAVYVCGCAGNEQGSVWGSGPYTADSNLCTAARHAGVIGPAGGTISVLGIGGLPGYAASEANGVRTSSWGSYGASVVFNLN